MRARSLTGSSGLTRRRGRELPDAEQPADGVQRGGDVPWLRVAVADLPGLLLAPGPGGGARPDGAGHGEPPEASALALGGRGDGLPAHHGLGHLPALFALPAGPGVTDVRRLSV